MTKTRIVPALFGALMLSAAAASPVAALTVADSASFSTNHQVTAVGAGSASNSGVFSGAYTLDLFDPSQGTLTGVTVSVSQTAAPTASLTFLCADAEAGCIGSGFNNITQSVNLSLGTVSAATGPVAGSAAGQCLGLFGCQDLFVGPLSTLTANYVFTNTSDLANFIGLGSFTLDRLLNMNAGANSLLDSAATSVLDAFVAPWAGTATVTYEYSALVAAVPEPGSAVALLLAAAGLFAARRRASASGRV